MLLLLVFLSGISFSSGSPHQSLQARCSSACRPSVAAVHNSRDLQGITGKLRNREYAGALDTLLSADGPGPERVILVVDHIELLAKHAHGKKVSSICKPSSAAW